MFEKIVLATDLSPAWDELVDCAAEFRLLGCTRIILTHVITTTFFAGLAESLRAEAQPALEQQKQRLVAQGFEVVTEMPLGLPAYSLNDVACRHGAGLIVVGSHGKSLWREGVLGSFSNAVVHQARYPVLVLKTTVDETKKQGTCRLEATEMLRHILFPTDFSTTADASFGISGSSGEKRLGQVTLLNALEIPGEDAFPPGYQEFTERQGPRPFGAMAATPLERRDSRGQRTPGLRTSHPGYSGNSENPRYFIDCDGDPGKGIR